MKYVSLNVLGMIGLSCYILADTFFVAKGLGSNGLTALNLSISVYSFIHGTGLMIGIGGATSFAILKALKKQKECNTVFTNAAIIGIIAGLIYLLLGIFLSQKLSTLLGADDITLPLTNVYLKTLLIGAPFFIFNNILIAFVRNDGDPRLSMFAMLIGSFSNIVLDYIFIFPFKMGMFGAAFATVLAPIISIAILSSHFIKKKNSFHIDKLKLEFQHIKEILSLGVSSFITEISSGIVLIIFNLIILKLAGNIGVAAYGIVANIALVAISIFVGIAQGVQPIISNNFGISNYVVIKKILKYALSLSILFSILLYGTILLCSNQLIEAFNGEHNTQLASLALDGLHLYFIGFFFAGINIILSYFYSSIVQPAKAFAVSICRGCAALIPIVLLLSSLLGLNGVWLSFPLAELITLVISLVFYAKTGKTLK